jgi:hypothetical protein
MASSGMRVWEVCGKIACSVIWDRPAILIFAYI